MPNYVPTPIPFDPKQLPQFLQSELRRIGADLADSAECVLYRTLPTQASLSVGVSANWKVAGNVFLCSTSNTQTFTGLQRQTDGASNLREVIFVNVGTGVVVLKSEGTESSASNRFALSTDWQLSRNAAAILWRDPYVARWRGISKT